MSKRIHINNDGTARSVASDRGIYTERAAPFCRLYTNSWNYTSSTQGMPWAVKDGDLAVTFNAADGSVTFPRAGVYLVDVHPGYKSITAKSWHRVRNKSNCFVTGYDSNYGSTTNREDNYSNGTTNSVRALTDGASVYIEQYVAGACTFNNCDCFITQLSVDVPYLVANGNGVVSDPRQGYVSINNDLTMSLNKPVNITTEFRAAITLNALSTKDIINNVIRYGDLIIASSYNGAILQATAIESGSTLFTVDPNSPFCTKWTTNTLLYAMDHAGTMSWEPNGNVRCWTGVSANSSILFQMIYFCKGE